MDLGGSVFANVGVRLIVAVAAVGSVSVGVSALLTQPDESPKAASPAAEAATVSPWVPDDQRPEREPRDREPREPDRRPTPDGSVPLVASALSAPSSGGGASGGGGETSGGGRDKRDHKNKPKGNNGNAWAYGHGNDPGNSGGSHGNSGAAHAKNDGNGKNGKHGGGNGKR